MPVSINYCRRFVCDLLTQCRNVHYLVCPMEVLKCLKFQQMNLSEGEFLAMVSKGVVHHVYKVVSQSSFGVTTGM